MTLQRALETLSPWQLRAPTLKLGTQGPEALAEMIDQFEPLAQACTAAQDELDAAERAAQDALAKMQLLGVKVPPIIEAQLDGNEEVMEQLRAVYRTHPRTEATILTRIRELYPVWLMADEAMAALIPPQPPITRPIQGTPHTAAMAKALLDDYNDLVKVVGQKSKLLAASKAALRALDVAADGLNKRWFKLMRNTFEPDSPVQEALDKIPTEPGTLVPTVLEIKSVKQGGEKGRQVLVRYAAKGGERATKKWLRWQVVGVDADFANELPLDPKGNDLGPFEPGTELRLVAEMFNSAGSRTSVPRSITITASIG